MELLFAATLDAVTVDNRGRINHAFPGSLLMDNGAIIDNRGIFDFQLDGSIDTGG